GGDRCVRGIPGIRREHLHHRNDSHHRRRLFVVTGVAPEFTRRDLQRLGLVSAADTIRLSPLPGGVSSDIFNVEAGGRVFVVDRALSKLRVADEWLAPTSRNRHEADWLEAVARILPGAAPTVLARDDQAGLFAMEYF